MSDLTGPRVVAIWFIWAILLGTVSRLASTVGLALPISTSAAIVLGEFLGPLLLLLFFAPPLLLTLAWWRRRRRPDASPR